MSSTVELMSPAPQSRKERTAKTEPRRCRRASNGDLRHDSAQPESLPQYRMCPSCRGDPAAPSALTHSEGAGFRRTLARMALAGLVQTKGRGLLLCSAM